MCFVCDECFMSYYMHDDDLDVDQQQHWTMPFLILLLPNYKFFNYNEVGVNLPQTLRFSFL